MGTEVVRIKAEAKTLWDGVKSHPVLPGLGSGGILPTKVVVPTEGQYWKVIQKQ